MSEQEGIDPKESKEGGKFNFYWLYGIIGVFLIAAYVITTAVSGVKQISREAFFRELLPAGDVKKINIVNNQQAEIFLYPDSVKKKSIYKTKYKLEVSNRPGVQEEMPDFSFTIPSVEVFEKDLQVAAEKYPNVKLGLPEYITRKNYIRELLVMLSPIILLVVIWFFFMRRLSGGMGGPGGQIFNIGKSKATLVDKGQNISITFDDVAGLDEAKGEVMEIVDFLKHPKKYTKLGGKIPKGALLIGPPGTGKTLIAKAMAGEAQVPFFSIGTEV